MGKREYVKKKKKGRQKGNKIIANITIIVYKRQSKGETAEFNLDNGTWIAFEEGWLNLLSRFRYIRRILDVFVNNVIVTQCFSVFRFMNNFLNFFSTYEFI